MYIYKYIYIYIYIDLYILTVEGTLGTPNKKEALLRQMSLSQTNYSGYEEPLDLDEILSGISEIIPRSDTDTQGNNVTNYF